MEYYSAIKKDILPFAVHHTWMNPEDTMLSEMNQTLKDDYCTVSLNLESKMSNSQKQSKGVSRGWSKCTSFPATRCVLV